MVDLSESDNEEAPGKTYIACHPKEKKRPQLVVIRAGSTDRTAGCNAGLDNLELKNKGKHEQACGEKSKELEDILEPLSKIEKVGSCQVGTGQVDHPKTYEES